MTKIINSGLKTNAFGGLNLIYPEFKKSGLSKIIDNSLGERVNQAKYSYSDVFTTHILNIFAGSQRLDHAYRFKKQLDNISDVLIPSPDTTSRIMRKLSVKNDEIEYTGKHKVHLYNTNDKMIDILIQSALKMGLIKRNGRNILDYDNTIISHKKVDSTATYMRGAKANVYGYFPALASINGVPIFVEGISGHTPASHQIANSIERCINAAKRHGIKITLLRSDAAGYNANVIKLCERMKVKFLIRKSLISSFKEFLEYDTYKEDWSMMADKKMMYEMADFHLPVPSVSKTKKYRIACKRVPFEGKMNYGCLITDIEDMSANKLIKFYDQRGAEEKRFAELKNEFNFCRLPFSHLEENTVFMIASCIAYNLYKYVLKKISKNNANIRTNMWLRMFRREFIFHTVIVQENSEFEFTNVQEETLLMYRKFIEDF